ncbi:MAG TPA: hypothetical protein VIK96_05645 [Bacilli bacterium]
MKAFKTFLLIAVGALSLLFLTGCSSFMGIKNDFEKAGYTYSEEANQYVEELMEEFSEKELVVKPHLFYKGLNYAIVLEFKTSKDLNEQLKKSETLQGMLKDLQKSDYVRGNCLLIPVGLDRGEMVEIFKGKK